MKQFIKFIFASCIGTMLALGGILFILYIIAVSTTPTVNVEANSVLQLKLNKAIPELTDNVPKGNFGMSDGTTIGLNDIKRHIRFAATDPNIKGILLQTESVIANPTTALAIAKEIDSFKASGKFVYAYGDYFTQSGYIIASTADSVYLNPNGLIDLRGYGTARPYYQDFSEKTGIDFNVYHAGKYKSAIEPYYRGESSPENRFQTKRYLQSFHNALVGHISNQRGQDISSIDRVVSGGLSNNSEDALTYGLIDTLKYLEDVKSLIRAELEIDETELVSLDTYHQANPKSSTNNKNKIAIIYAEGDVAAGGEERGAITMDIYDEIFDRLEKNEKVGAVVLRINSPGGSSWTSDRFWKRVGDLKANGKYVIASFGDYAASGGYYIAANVDKIISEPTTLTGSIGVFSMMPDFTELSEEKLGIHWDTIGTGKRTFLYSPFIKKSDADNALLMAETERIYRQFKKVVAQGRQLSPEEVQEVAQGRVWTGTDALVVGLVDELGGLDDAIKIAATESEYGDDYKILEYPIIEKDFWEKMLESFGGHDIQASAELKLVSPLMNDLRETLAIIEQACETPQTRMPFSVLVD